MTNAKTTIVLSPGFENAGPQHWQTHIQRKYENTTRVEQQNWTNPERDIWIAQLEKTVAQIAGDLILVGHSCGANVIAQWAEQHDAQRVKGALLVAPADIDDVHAMKEIQVQRPLTTLALPFPSIVISSDNDGHITEQRARYFSQCWGSQFVLIPGADHFQTEAGFGDWPLAEQLIEQLNGKPCLHKRPQPIDVTIT